jgi:hypothetical protein
MRNFKIIGILLLLAVYVTSCKKDHPYTATSPVNGNWKVESFIKDGVDLSSQFSGYTFVCNSEGGMTIQGHGNTYSHCSWNSHNSTYYILIMGCDNNSVLWECNGDWDLTTYNSSHCYFASHNPNYHNTMIWVKI